MIATTDRVVEAERDDDREGLLLDERYPTIVAVVAHARSVPSDLRESFAARLEALPPADGLVVVHTCHRVEAYIAPSSYPESALPSCPPGIRRLTDVDAARHLITVACGLDSAILGEDQILHQLRVGYAARHATGALDPVLDRLFQAALHGGRVAHSWFNGATRSLADVAVERIARQTGSLEGRSLLVVGAGKMGRLAAVAASRRGARVVLSNRTRDRAAGIAREIGAEVVPFHEDGTLPRVDAVVLAIGGQWMPGPCDTSWLRDGTTLVVDLSSPPAVSRELRAALGDRFVSVDDLAAVPPLDGSERLRRRIEALVSETGREYCRWLRARESVPAIQALADAAEAQRAEELEWLLRRLPDMPPDERLAVEQMTHRLVAGILHRPLAALNEDQTGRLEQAARDLFRI